MKHKIRIILLLITLLVVTGVAFAAATDFAIPWWTVDGGGGTTEGGDYTLSSNIGQPDAGPLMSGGEYTVVGGFWGGAIASPNQNVVYLPCVLK